MSGIGLLRSRSLRRLLAISPTLLAGCGHLPAALDPHGSNAQQTAQIAWVLFSGGGLIFALVIAAVLYAVFVSPARRGWLSSQGFVVGAGIVFPAVALTALLLYTLTVWGSLFRDTEAVPVKIEIVGEMWWWRIRYVDASGALLLETANELHVPVGKTVQLALSSADVLHSFWVPQLSGKLDMIPGRVNVLKVRADAAGVFRGQCAEYCGAQHAKMAFHVIAHAPSEYESWLAAQRMPAAAPRTPALERGAGLFLTHCGACHAVSGTSAAGRLGPDLTHVGSRRFIAAGTLPNNAGTLAGWIASSQHIKPENRMPSFDRFSAGELLALSTYLESLR